MLSWKPAALLPTPGNLSHMIDAPHAPPLAIQPLPPRKTGAVEHVSKYFQNKINYSHFFFSIKYTMVFISNGAGML